MIKKLLVFIIGCLPVAALAQTSQFTIEGSLGAYNSPAKVYLQYAVNDKDITDSATLVNGKFKFTGQVGADPVIGLMLFNAKGNGMNNQDLKSVILEKGVIKVSGTDMLKHAVASGTVNNADYEKYNACMAPVTSEQEKFFAEMNKPSDEEKKSVAYEDKFFKGFKAIQEKQNAVTKKFITENPDSYISLYTLNNYAYGADYKDIEPLYNIISPRLKQTNLGQKLAGRLPKIKAIAYGEVAPDFTEGDTSGKMVSLSSFRGKYVLVDFWASWCHPCRAENPNVLKAYDRYKGKNFTVVAISLDGPGERNNWLTAVKQDGLPWTQVSDLKAWDDRAAQLYLINGIPQNFLLDPDGKIIAKNLRGTELEGKLGEVLGNN